MTMMSESKFSEINGNLSKMSRFEEISAEEARKTQLRESTSLRRNQAP